MICSWTASSSLSLVALENVGVVEPEGVEGEEMEYRRRCSIRKDVSYVLAGSERGEENERKTKEREFGSGIEKSAQAVWIRSRRPAPALSTTKEMMMSEVSKRGTFTPKMKPTAKQQEQQQQQQQPNPKNDSKNKMNEYIKQTPLTTRRISETAN
jgi:hypothetical protein